MIDEIVFISVGDKAIMAISFDNKLFFNGQYGIDIPSIPDWEPSAGMLFPSKLRIEKNRSKVVISFD